MQKTDIEHALAEVSRNNPEIVAALLIEPSGVVRASDAVAPEVTRAATALAVPARDLLERVAAELGCGALKTVLIEGELASLAFADIDGSSMGVLVGASGAAPGALRADAHRLATRLAQGDAS
jgi:predicted regulator of Ras-like GTPase activity (Roadblock/LC7/MglB family)